MALVLAGLSACVSSSEYQNITAERNEAIVQLTTQENELSRLKAAISEEQTKAAALRRQATELKTQLSLVQSESADIEEKVAKIGKALEAEEAETSRLASELSDTNDTNVNQSQQIDGLKMELTQAQTANTSLEQQLSDTKDTNVNQSQQLDGLTVELAGAQTTNIRLEQQVNDLRSQITFLQSLASQMQAESPSLVKIISAARPATVRIQTETGEGSGFFFDEEGHILTNAHVVESARYVTVVVSDSSLVTGQVLGRDELMDVAVVKVLQGKVPSFLTLGDSSKAQVGDGVVTMGYPLGGSLGGQTTATNGIISSVRLMSNVGYLQIDAAINPGNSGGPLLTDQGDVIGMNTWGIREVGGLTIESIGFAIAINQVKSILPSLMAGGVVTVPSTGWTTYQNAYWRYSIRVPPGWTIDDADQDAIRIWSPGRGALVNIWGLPAGGHTLESCTNYLIDFRRSEATSFTEISRTKVFLPGNIPAYSSLIVDRLADVTSAG
ncbi:MAG: trypsin-like peptidase domain-containing protein, partial [Dehalococcoidia bacterium]|nr:trypsin-like peptidase domain-containing protein [Dehalococcoidia bacterium]